MKKALCMVTAAALAAMSLVGCGSSGTSAPAETKAAETKADAGKTEAAPAASNGAANMVFSWWGNQVRNEVTQNAIDLYQSQNPGVSIDGQFSEWADYWDKLATAAAGNSLPDIIQMDYKYLDQYVANGLLLDLTPYVKDGTLNLNDCDQNIVNAGKVGDGLYAICHGINSPALLYNKTITDEAGVTIKDNMTLDEFVAASKTIHEKTGYKTNMSYGVGENFVEYFERSNDAVMYTNGKLGGKEQDYVEYFKLYENGIKDGWHLDPSVFAERTIGSIEQDPMVYGSSPETMSWCSFAYTNQLVATRAAAPEGANIQMTTWPAKDPKKSDYMKPGQFLSVSATAKDPAAAVKFINWWTNDVECNTTLKAERGIPLSSKVAEAVAPKLDASTAEIASFLNNVVAPNSSQINPPSGNGTSEVNDLLDKLEEQVCYGQMTAEEAGKQLFEQGNKIMAEKAAAK